MRAINNNLIIEDVETKADGFVSFSANDLQKAVVVDSSNPSIKNGDVVFYVGRSKKTVTHDGKKYAIIGADNVEVIL